MAQVVKVLIAAAVLFTYGLQLFVPLEIICNSIKPFFSHRYAASGEAMMRVCIVMLTGKMILHHSDAKMLLQFITVVKTNSIYKQMYFRQKNINSILRIPI